MEKIFTDIIYTFILNDFDGVFPCDDNGLMTFAIGNARLRYRVGSEFLKIVQNSLDEKVWILGFAGKKLENSVYLEGQSAGDIIFIAEITGVLTYDEYFSQNINRRDMIYEPCAENSFTVYGTKIYNADGQFFRHKGSRAAAHFTAAEQDADWDDKYGQNYVLCSNKYSYVSKEQGVEIMKLLNIKKPAARKITVKDKGIKDTLLKAVSVKDHGIKYRPDAENKKTDLLNIKKIKKDSLNNADPISPNKKLYSFLKADYGCRVIYDGEWYPSVQHAYQAAKTLDEDERQSIAISRDPAEARRCGRALKLRPGWEDIKDEVMYECQKSKFANSETLKQMLLATANREIIFNNNKKDRYWGVYRGEGENMEGKIVMRIREELAAKQPE